MKRICLILTICTILILTIFYNYKNNSIKYSKSDISDLINIDELDNYAAIGIYDKSGTIIDNGSNINVNKGEIINQKLDIEIKSDNSSNYLLLIMADFKQIKFQVDNDSVTSYNFNLKNIDSKTINLFIDIPTETKELCYILIKDNNLNLNEDDFESMLRTQHIITYRFNINCSTETNIKYEQNVVSSTEGTYDDIWISTKEDELKAICNIDEEEIVYMTLGNHQLVDIGYAVILLCDGKQIDFSDNETVKYFNVKSNSKQVFKLKLPGINKQSNFQAVAFPMPYYISENKSPFDTSAFGSIRFRINDTNN